MVHGIAKSAYPRQHHRLSLPDHLDRVANLGGCANGLKGFLDVSKIANVVVNDCEFRFGHKESFLK
jgi:hypothetical protein